MDIVTDINVLRRHSEPVAVGEDIAEIISALEERVMQKGVAGLAAIQLGFPKRIFIMRNFPKTPLILVNPKIIKTRGELRSKEGCLSLPGIMVELKRPRELKIEGKNQYGFHVRYQLSGLMAASASHEFDHLDGKLIIDYRRAA